MPIINFNEIRLIFYENMIANFFIIILDPIKLP